MWGMKNIGGMQPNYWGDIHPPPSPLDFAPMDVDNSVGWDEASTAID